MSAGTPDPDPPPPEPHKPAAGDCCGGGCDPCIFEIYADELTRYQEALANWQARRASGNDGREEVDRE